ncbi:MAG: D-cysteine desulfhydrase family protein, partial [Rhodospirillaceae bacterium]|nr:D-cysteine desulfhydrase family protein [Rhodospirillaceae bacterium]
MTSNEIDAIAAGRIRLAQLPTPLEPMERLSEHLGAEIWIKRDDLTGFAGGGNKVRKLEFLMPQAKAAGADTVLTIGALQSNHARQTAAAAARLGFGAVLVLAEVVEGRTEAYAHGGNLALDRLVGAAIRRVPPGEDVEAAIAEMVEEREAAGEKVFVIPVGGSNLVGALGYVEAAKEIERQAEAAGLSPERIVTASGSSGTQAGLVLGTAIPVLGISVAASNEELTAKVKAIVDEGCRYPRFSAAAERPIRVDDGFVGKGYGQPTEEMLEALSLVARLEGIFLDPVYSGKAMAGVVHMARAGRLPGATVFVHTGGMPAIFA